MGIRNRFRLDLPLVYRLLETIPGKGASNAEMREAFPDLGDEKVRGIREWAEYLGLTCRNGQVTALSPLGKAAVCARSQSTERRLLEIMYYKLATRADLEVFRALVNDFLFDVVRALGRSFTLIEARALVADFVDTQADPRYVRGEVSTALSALTSERGLGRLGIVIPTGENHYLVTAYRPDWRTAAYILYDSWPENTSRVRIDEVVTGEGSLGRIFLMVGSQVMALLSRLEQERAIALEVVADLNQIGINPTMKAADFLEMLSHDED